MSLLNRCLYQLNNTSIQLDETDERMLLPKWATFLSWAGFWMATKQIPNGHVLMVILLPTRVCASAFCLLGGLLGRASLAHFNNLSFSEFSSLPEGTEISLVVNGSKVKAVILAPYEFGGTRGLMVGIVSGGKQFKSSSIFIHEGNFSNYQVTLDPPASVQADRRLFLVESYYKKILGKVSKHWIRMEDTEAVLWTNKARWKKELDDFKVVRKKLNPIPFADLLLLQNNRVLLKSPRSAKLSYHDCAFAILDGAETINRVDQLKARNRILILDRSEYSPIVETRIAELSNFRNDALLDISDFNDVEVPKGAEVIAFAIGG